MGAASAAVNRRPHRQGKLARFDGMRSEKPGRRAARLAREDSADDGDLLAHTDVAIETRLQVLPVVALPSSGGAKGPQLPGRVSTRLKSMTPYMAFS